MGDEAQAPQMVSPEDLASLRLAVLREENGRLAMENAQLQRNAIIAKYGSGVSVNMETGQITRAG